MMSATESAEPMWLTPARFDCSRTIRRMAEGEIAGAFDPSTEDSWCSKCYPWPRILLRRRFAINQGARRRTPGAFYATLARLRLDRPT